jgi:hypothetical protein
VTNRFKGWCSGCRSKVPTGAGFLAGKNPTTGIWQVLCPDCHGAARRPSVTAAPGPALPQIPECLVTLGLDPPVTADMVNARFRALALESHPDRGGTARRFIEVRHAYQDALRIARGAL